MADQRIPKGNITIEPVGQTPTIDTLGYSLDELKAIARGAAQAFDPRPQAPSPQSVDEIRSIARDKWDQIYQPVQTGRINVDETGLEPHDGFQYGAPPGVRKDFPLVQTQRSAGEPLKPIFQALGGTGGALLGGATGPGTAVVGGGLGTAAGSYGYDVYRDLLRKVSPDYTLPPSASERLLDPVKDAQDDMLFGAGVAGLPALSQGVRSMAKKGLKITPEDEMLAKEALGDAFINQPNAASKLAQKLPTYLGGVKVPQTAANVPIGIADLKHDVPQAGGYVRTMSRLPWLGAPSRAARENKLAGWEQMWNKELGLFGPPMDSPMVSKKAVEGAEDAWKAFRSEVDTKYDAARKLAVSEGPIVDSQKIIDASIKGMNELLSNRPTLMTGQTAHTDIPDYVRKFTDQLQDLPPKLTVGNLDWLENELANVLSKAQKDGFQFKTAADIRKAAGDALRDASVTSAAAKALIDTDKFFHNGMKLFETPTGQKFERTDKNIFSLGHSDPGKINSDVMNSIILNAKSPQAISDLERLIGKPQMGNVARKYIEDVVNGARVEDKTGKYTYNVGDIVNKFKLDNPRSAEYQAFGRLLKSTGVDINDFKRVLDITKVAFGNEIPDVATYMSRAMGLAALGGTGAALSAGMGHLLPVLSPALIIGAIAARHGNRVLTDPNKLRNILRLYDSNLPTTQKRMALLRVYQSMSGNAVESDKQDKLFPPSEKLPNNPSGELSP